MPFISRRNVDLKLRVEHDQLYKGQLRQALLNPGITAEQRTRIREELALAGITRIYSADRPPRPGAIK